MDSNLEFPALDEPESCIWEDDAADDFYHTGCGHHFQLNEDSAPLDEWMHYCCYCGKKAEIWIDGEQQNA